MTQFETGDAQRELRRARIATALSAHWDELAAPSKQENFSIMRMIGAMAEQKFNRRDSYEGAVVDAQARANLTEFDPQRAMVPFGVFANRNLTVATSSAGGNLVGSATGDFVDALRPYSVLTRMGIGTIEPGAENLLVPNVTTPAAGQWLADEQSALSTANPVIGLISSSPKTAGSLVKASLSFARHARQGEAFIRAQLLGAMADTLDRAILQGTGSNGEPTGLKYATGVEQVTNILPETQFISSNAIAMESIAGTAGAYDLKWVTSPTQRKWLRQELSVPSTNGGLWRDGKILDYPAFVTTHCPSEEVFLGDWSRCKVAFWGGGLKIEVDPFTSFKTGAVMVRVLMHCDVYFEKPGSFVRYVYTP